MGSNGAVQKQLVRRSCMYRRPLPLVKSRETDGGFFFTEGASVHRLSIIHPQCCLIVALLGKIIVDLVIWKKGINIANYVSIFALFSFV